jgi:tRNA(Ile2) C34 agmatinyltransferase TiaS
MATDGPPTAFSGLAAYYDRTEPVCPECGYRDDDGGWVGETDGRRVHYRHACPSCDAVRERTVRLGE